MKISYAITVCNEIEEIKRLIPFLLEHKRDEDEIVIQQDDTDFSAGIASVVESYCRELAIAREVVYTHTPLMDDFGSFKNQINKHCTGDFIFQIDADEIPNKFLIENLSHIIRSNDFDVCMVPRVNTVEGLTETHIQKWGWKVNENGWVNWPDYQMRLYRNDPVIKWEGKVHEKITGFQTWTMFPEVEDMALYHPKHIDRQEKQNNFYEQL